MPFAVSDDFLAFVLNEDFGDDLASELAFVAPASTHALLAQRGLIRAGS